MKVAALIDYTPTTEVVIEFAYQLGLRFGAEIALVTVVHEAHNTEILKANEALLPVVDRFQSAGITCKIEIHEGNFMTVIGSVVEKLHCTLAIIGTHGKRGLKQNLFGSNILKLVKLLKMPSLVLQDDSVFPENGFKRVFFPIAAHSRFEMKVDQTEQLLDKDGKVSLYALYKTDNLDDDLKKNVKLCEDEFGKRALPMTLLRRMYTCTPWASPANHWNILPITLLI
jgi:nucleotide-binding universal stress UspA family protein